MPRLKYLVPKLRKHKSGQAVVTICGVDHYLGLWGARSQPSLAVSTAYDAKVAEWLAAGRPTIAQRETQQVTVAELLLAFLRDAKATYGTDSKSSRYFKFRQLVKRLRVYDKMFIVDFGPQQLKGIRQQMISEGLGRSTINQSIGSIKQIFKWGVTEQLVPITSYQALQCVAGLRKGYTNAPEGEPVTPVAMEVVEKTIPFMPLVVQDMVRLHCIIGCRPSEVCLLKWSDIDTSSLPWKASLREHKNAHRGKERIMYFGPRARKILERHTSAAESGGYVFSPRESEAKRIEVNAKNRTTPLNQGNRRGYTEFSRTGKRKRTRAPRLHYDRSSYLRAIHRSCDKAFPAPESLTEGEVKRWQKKHRWYASQIMHTVATVTRSEQGLEVAGILLGHSELQTTQIYAERDYGRLKNFMEAMG